MQKINNNSMIEKVGIGFRPYLKLDEGFVLSSWLRSNRRDWRTSIPKTDVYFKLAEPLVKKILDRAGCLIAYNTDNPNQIYAYICAENWDNALLCHYIYVKYSFRRMGLGSYMYNMLATGKQIVFSTFNTPLATQLIDEEVVYAIYNPFLLFDLPNIDTQKITHPGVVTI